MSKEGTVNPDRHYQQALATLNKFIADKGLRHTQEREIVLRHALQLKGRFTVDELAATPGLNVSRGTVVNCVNTFTDLGILLKAGMRGRFVLYQARPKTSRGLSVYRTPFAVSLQCRLCGRSKEVHDKTAVAPLAKRTFNRFFPSGGVVTIFGLCAECADKQQNKETKKK